MDAILTQMLNMGKLIGYSQKAVEARRVAKEEYCTQALFEFLEDKTLERFG